jgi:hypothetical protein
MKFLIDFKADVTQEQIDSYFNTNQCDVIKVYNAFEKVYLVTCDKLPQTTDIIEFVVQDDDVPLIAHEIYTNNGLSNFSQSIDLVPTDNQWWMTYSIEGVQDVTAPNINIPKRGKNVNIYLVDSGIDISHEEFSDAQISLLHSFTPDDFTDSNGHGTSLASVMVGKTCGLSDSHLKVVKIFQNEVPLFQSQLLEAFDAIYNDMVANSNVLPIINMSWQISHNPYINSKVMKLMDHGAICVVAAGNSGNPISDVTPACVPGVIVIGSYDKDFKPSSFSQYTMEDLVSSPDSTNHGKLSGWAPGENIYSASIKGGYRLASGTSISAAIHTSALAYNFSYMLDTNGKLVESFYRDSNYIVKNLINGMSLSKYRILDLSDSKYAGSANYTTAYRIGDYHMDDNDVYRLPPNSIFGIYDNTFDTMVLGAPWIYDKIEITYGNLPDNYYVENTFIHIKPNNVCGDKKYVTYYFTIKLYNKEILLHQSDATLNVFNENLKNIDVTHMSEPTQDPELDILLSGSCDSATTLADCSNSLCFTFTGFCKACGAIPKYGYFDVCVCSTAQCP